MTRHRLLSALAAGALGAGVSAGVAACGEDRGGVTVEGGTTATTGTTATSTAPTTATTETTP